MVYYMLVYYTGKKLKEEKGDGSIVYTEWSVQCMGHTTVPPDEKE